MNQHCEIGRFLRRCHQPGTGVCQYCGRAFCDRHTGLHDGEIEICSRPLCLAKHADLQAHLVYRDAALARSNRGFCGSPECSNTRAGQCSKCQALFCDNHLQTCEETYRQGLAVLKRPISACEHCAARIKLWARQ